METPARKTRSWLAGGLAGLALASVVQAGEVTVPSGGLNQTVAVRSMQELRFFGAVRQQYDFSCGAAAVATLLTHHYGRPTSETQVFKEMWVRGDQAKIRRVGFSLFDMKQYLRAHGFDADGFRVSLEQLRRASIPGIALVDVDGYKHFVVVKGIDGSHVLIADPAMGVRLMDREKFEDQRGGVMLVVRNHVQTARSNFNSKADWALRPTPPVKVGVGPGGNLGSFTMLLPSQREF